ncbi:selenium metabolism-associated LysR family transcriptional regulator [uncultured Desulfuromusa sp.]|uniref:selenium metabolism-associated LysR family transcriptional regulator n=1 Tax=uncultured Desulfuromusa sp. TaxID=219183 RepID=UPI002AA5F879|nr:selenium metabolism-associated LysR family transcriptional regulator [uncultured Desulfuromusa sp.]
MTLRQLELFIAVAETRSFSRGAELIALTQSTVSQHIAALERETSTRLLDRTNKGIFLTAGGEVFLQHARRVLAERDVLLQSMAGLHGLEKATLNLGASNIPANYLIPCFLPVLKRNYPGISLTMKIGDSKEVLDELKSGQLELGIVGGRVDDEIYTYEPLLKDQLVMIVGPDHPLRGRQSITKEELEDEVIVLREEGSGTYQALLKAFLLAGIDLESFRVIARLGSNEAVRRAIAAGFGCAFVSDLSVQNNLRHGELFKVDVEGLSIERQLWLVRLRERTASPASIAFSELLKGSDVLKNLYHCCNV